MQRFLKELISSQDFSSFQSVFQVVSKDHQVQLVKKMGPGYFEKMFGAMMEEKIVESHSQSKIDMRVLAKCMLTLKDFLDFYSECTNPYFKNALFKALDQRLLQELISKHPDYLPQMMPSDFASFHTVFYAVSKDYQFKIVEEMGPDYFEKLHETARDKLNVQAIVQSMPTLAKFLEFCSAIKNPNFRRELFDAMDARFLKELISSQDFSEMKMGDELAKYVTPERMTMKVFDFPSFLEMFDAVPKNQKLAFIMRVNTDFLSRIMTDFTSFLTIVGKLPSEGAVEFIAKMGPVYLKSVIPGKMKPLMEAAFPGSTGSYNPTLFTKGILESVPSNLDSAYNQFVIGLRQIGARQAVENRNILA